MKNTRKSPKTRTLKEERMAFRTGFARLVENEMEKAEVVLAFKSIIDKFQDIAEKLVKIEAEDMMPNLDALRAAYGPSVADRFYQSMNSKIRGAIETIQSTRAAIDTEVLKLEGVINGEPANDMAVDDGGMDMPPEDDATAPEGDLPPPDAGGDDAGAPPAGGEPPPEEEPEIDLGDEDEEDPVFSDRGAPAAGRARKESAAPKGKRLKEDGTSFRQMRSRAQNAPKDALDKRRDYADRMTDSGRFVADAVPAIGKMAKNKDAAKGAVKSMFPLGGPKGKLPESRNLDPLILQAFRRSLAEGVTPIKAAKKVAERFAVELADVIEIVKEAKGKAKKKKPDCGCDQGEPAKKPWEKDAKGKVAETRRPAPRKR